MNTIRRRSAFPVIKIAPGGRRGGWFLLFLFVFQLTAGALHRLEHGKDRFSPKSDGTFHATLHAFSGRPDAAGKTPIHDPAHCSVCQHLLSNSFALPKAVPSIARFEAFLGGLVPISAIMSHSTAHGRKSRAPPVSLPG